MTNYNQEKPGLCIVCDFPPNSYKGGVEILLANDLPKLKMNFDVHIITVGKTGRELPEDNIDYVDSFYNSPMNTIVANLKILLKILKLSKSNHLKIIHAHSNKCGVAGLLAAKLLRCKFVITIHFAWPLCVKGTLLTKKGEPCGFESERTLLPKLNFCLATCFREVSFTSKVWAIISSLMDQFLLVFADKLVCVSEDMRKRLHNFSLVTRKVEVIANFPVTSTLDDLICSDFRKRMGILPNEKMILFLGRVSYEKGTDILITAMENVPDFAKLLIVGRCDSLYYLSHLKKLIIQLRLENRVHLTGFLSRMDVYAAIAACDVLVVPSRWYEMFPSVVLEGLAFGKPVIASSFGGAPEMFKGGKGFLVEPGSVKELSSAIAKITSDPKFIQEKTMVGNLKGDYNHAQHLSKLLDLYKRLAKPTPDMEGKSMSILVISPGFAPWKIGGEEYYASCLAKTLANRGHKVCVIAESEKIQGNTCFKFSDNLKLVLVRSTRRGFLELFRCATRYLTATLKLRLKPDLIHGHDPYSQGLAAVIAGKILRVPVIITWHGAELIEGRLSLLGNMLRRFVTTQADAIVVNTQVMKKLAIRNTGLSPKKFHVVQPSIDANRFRPTVAAQKIREKYGLKDSLVVLSVCRLERIKGINKLIEAIPNVAKEIPEVKFLIVGDGSEKENLENLATRLGIRQLIIFTGYVEENELPHYYASCDVFAVPTFGEGFGLVFLEAWASGKPIVVTPYAPEISKLASSKQAGIVADADPVDISKALVKLLSNRGMRDKMGMMGRKIVESQLSWEEIARKNLELYGTLIK